MEYWVDELDMGIERLVDSEIVIIRDGDGNHVTEFPANWTNEQIEFAMTVANTAFDEGVAYGKMMKIRELKKVLEM